MSQCVRVGWGGFLNRRRTFPGESHLTPQTHPRSDMVLLGCLEEQQPPRDQEDENHMLRTVDEQKPRSLGS